MERYSQILEKNPREIVLLRGSGCQWRRCAFCDYHTDASPDAKANFLLNRDVLSHVSGVFHRLEVINSGSFVDLDAQTVDEIERVATACGIHTLHFECHWMHRDALSAFRARFARIGIAVIFKIGIETFVIPFREQTLQKGLGHATPAQIAAAGFSEINLLFGLDGQSVLDMRNDMETGLAYFDRICVNLMNQNTSKLAPSPSVIHAFLQEVYPQYREHPRVDILINNTDFGVG